MRPEGPQTRASGVRPGVSRDVPGKWLKFRIALLGLVFGAMLLVVFGRAVKLQIFDQDTLEGLARDQYIRQLEVPARRGDIYDRRGVPLAQSVEVDSVWVDPSMIPDVPAAAAALARELELDAADLRRRMERGSRFAWVKRKLKPREVEAVRALALPGVGFTKEPRRYYPQRELAAHVVGLVGTDGHGLEGLERAFDDELTGEAGSLASLRDARGHKLLMDGTVDSQDHTGASVALTIDRHLQFVTEKALTRAVESSGAKAGMAVVMDPATGEILAVANEPRFNPNVPETSQGGRGRNRAVLDVFEPGSTFKGFLMAAALETGAVTEGQSIDCEQGKLKIGRNTINDTHKNGVLTLEQILQVSSNICTAKIAQVMGRDRLQAYYKAFGFGERTGLNLPGEGRGSVPYPRSEIALANQSFGQGVSATALQMTAAFAALANDGVLMRPYLVRRVTAPDGPVLAATRPAEVRRGVSPAVARSVVKMMESVVDRKGTAVRAAVPGFRVSGKTGTAQKVDPVARGYSDKRIASFIGTVPAQAPRLVIHVVIDEPETSVYGGVVAAPAFREIATDALSYLGVAPTEESAPIFTASLRLPDEPPPAISGPDVELAVEEEPPAEGSVRVPDLAGQVGREAVSRLLGLELEARLTGSGRVVSQQPAPGSVVEKGAQVTLELASR